MMPFIIFIFSIYLSIQVQASNWLQCNTGFYQDPNQSTCQACTKNCFDCGFFNNQSNASSNSSCLQCAQSYYYNSIQQTCEQSCPSGTLTNPSLQICQPCQVQNCQQCDSNPAVCKQCLPNFSLSNGQCLLSSTIFNSNQIITDIPSLLNENECTQYIDDSFNSYQNQVQYSLLNEDSTTLYIFTPFLVLKYNTTTLSLDTSAPFNINGYVRDCGIYPPDLNNFYCTIRPNLLIQYDRNHLNWTQIAAFSGTFAGYGGWQSSTYYGRLYQTYSSGYIDSFLTGGIQVYSFQQQKMLSFMISGFTLQNYFNLMNFYQGYILFDQSKDSLYFKQNDQTQYKFLSSQTSYVFNTVALNANYFMILHRFGVNVCKVSSLFTNTSISLQNDCYPQSTPQMMVKYSFPSINTYFSSDNLVALHENIYGALLIYDYSQSPNVVLAYGTFNTTLHYQYIGNRRFILLNFNGQISLLTIPLNGGQAIETITPAISQHIFYLSFTFEIFADKILIVNLKQAFVIYFNSLEKSPVESVPYTNIINFINQNNNLYSIQPIFGYEQITNFDFVVKIHYDLALNLYIFVKNYQVRLRYNSMSVFEKIESVLDLEINSGKFIQSLYISSTHQLVIGALNEQYIINIPSLTIFRRDKLSIISERQNIYRNGAKLITCALEASNYFQYISVDLSQNTSYVSNVFMLIQDYFFGLDKIAILNSTQFQIITLSTNTTVIGTPGFTMTFTSNIFFETSLTSYLAIYQAGAIPKMLIYDTSSTSFVTPSLVLTYPNIQFTSQMFDYYNGIYSLYTIQSDGIYAYEVDSNNNFIQKGYFQNTQINIIQTQSKLASGQSFSKVLIYQAQQGVIVIDKITKQFYIISSTFQTSSVMLLVNYQLNSEVLVMQSLTITKFYQLFNNQYHLVAPLQSTCQNIRYLDSSEISCFIASRNETTLIPLQSNNLIQLTNYASPISNMAFDSANLQIAITLSSSTLRIISFNYQSEQLVFTQTPTNGASIQYIGYDPNLQIFLYTTNQNNLWSQVVNQNPVNLLSQTTSITWTFVAFDKQAIMVNLQGMIYSINYVTGAIYFTDNLISRLITSPCTVISYDRLGDYVFIYVQNQKTLKYSITSGIVNIVNFTSAEIYINLQRIDGAMFVLTNNLIEIFDSIQFSFVSSKSFTSLKDSFSVIQVSNTLVYCQPSTILQSYLIDINTLAVYLITYKTTLYSTYFDILASRVGVFTTDNTLTIQDMFGRSTVATISFTLSEFSDDIQTSSSSSLKVSLYLNINLDCALVQTSSCIYVYSISQKILLYAIRRNSSFSLLQFWIINSNIVLTYDQAGVYMYDLHSILKQQSRFKSSKFKIRDIQIYESQTSGLTQGLVENVFTKQLKNIQLSNGQLQQQYQMIKSFTTPQLINYQVGTSFIFTSKTKIIIQQNVIYIIDATSNTIQDSFNISPINAVASITSYLLNNNSQLYIYTYDNQIFLIDLIAKITQKQASVTLNPVIFIVECSLNSYIFQYSSTNSQNSLLCFSKANLNFIDMSSALNSFSIQNEIKLYQKINDSTILIQTQEGYLYQFSLNGCQFNGTPTQILTTSVSMFFYDQNLSRLFVQRVGNLFLEIYQNNQLVKTSMNLPYIKSTKIKISDDLSYYILFSDLFISIYYSTDIKLKTSMIQVFSQSEIKDVLLYSADYILVITNTGIFCYHTFQNQVVQIFQYQAEMPKLISSQMVYSSTNQLSQINAWFYSEQGFLQFSIPVIQDITATSKKCFTSLDLYSQNSLKQPSILDYINRLTYLNQQNQNQYQLDIIIFTIGQLYSLKQIQNIPLQISNLVLDSNALPKYSSIKVDNYFTSFNSISSDLYIRNTNIVFQETGTWSITNPNITISNQNIIYLQNIAFKGTQKIQYFTFTSNSIVALQNVMIQDIVFNSQQPGAFLNFVNSGQITIQNLTIQNIVLNSNITLFYFLNTTKVVIQNLVIQNVTCEYLTIFSASSSIETDISQSTISNVNCKSLQLLTGQMMQIININNISFLNVNSTVAQQTISIQSVQKISITNVSVDQCNGLKIVSLQKYVSNNIIYTVNTVSLSNISVTSYTDINTSSTRSRMLQSTSAQPSSEIISILDCSNLTIDTLTFKNLVLSMSQLLTISSSTAVLTNFIFDNIKLSSTHLSSMTWTGTNLSIEYLTMKSIQNLVIFIVNSEIVSLSNLHFTNNILNSPYSYNGILSLESVYSLTLSNNVFESNQVFQPSNGLINLYNIDKFLISDSQFNENISQQSDGSCIYVQSNTINGVSQSTSDLSVISNCAFNNNESQNSQGGAIYILEQNIEINNSVFFSNSAVIGGAIKISSLYILPQFFIDILQEKPSTNQFIGNRASLYGQNIGYFPQQVMATYQNTSMIYQQDVFEIDNFQSNTNLDNIVIKILDNEGYSIQFPSETLSLLNNNIQQEFLNYQFAINLKDDKIFISQSAINLVASEYFTFNATLIMAPNSSDLFTIRSTGTTPTIVQNSTGIFIEQKYMELTIRIQSMGCKVGDYFETISHITYCVPCPYGQYSLSIPTQISNLESKQISCINCPSEALWCQGSTIQLRNGYWRESNLTDNIYTCNSQSSSCQAQDPSSVDICGVGYIGPLCQTCDSQGSLWSQKYATGSQNSCEVCYQTSIQIIGIIGFILFTTTYLIIIVMQNLKCSQNKILTLYTEKIIGISLGCKIDFSRNSVLIKILMSFIQLYMILDGSGFKIPNQTKSTLVFGDPTFNVLSSMTCLLSSIEDLKQQMIYRILLKLFFGFLYFAFCMLALSIRYFVDKTHSKKISFYYPYLNMIMKVMFIYGGFGIVTDCVKALTCIQIGSRSYRLIDYRIECSSNVYDDLSIYILAGSLTIIISVIIPLYLLIRIIQISKNNQQNKIYSIKRFNFMIQEYKQKAAYWEIVKITLKYIIIFIINFLEQDYFAKIQLAVLILVAYSMILVRIKPYKHKTFNNYDLFSILTCQITLLCTACNLSSSNPYLQSFLLFIIILINTVFLVGMAFQFIKGIRIRADSYQHNPFKRCLLLILKKLQPYIGKNNIITSNQSNSLVLWIKLKKKILGVDGITFIEQFQKKMSSSKENESRPKASTFIKNSTPFKLDSYSFTSSQAPSQLIKFSTSSDQEHAKLKPRQDSFSPLQIKQQSNFNSSSKQKSKSFQIQDSVDESKHTQEYEQSHSKMFNKASQLHYADNTDSLIASIQSPPSGLNPQLVPLQAKFTNQTDEDLDQCTVTNHETESIKFYQSSVHPKRKILMDQTDSDSPPY